MREWAQGELATGRVMIAEIKRARSSELAATILSRRDQAIRRAARVVLGVKIVATRFRRLLSDPQCGHKPYPSFFAAVIILAYRRPGTRMRRREFILGLAMLADVGRPSAQDRARRVGVLVNFPEPNHVFETLLETLLKEKGWIVGRNLQI